MILSFKQPLRLARMIGLTVLLIPLSACAISGKPMEGRVLEVDTRKPIPDAIVVVRWQGNRPAFVESQTVCAHVDTAVTDAQGRYAIKRWVAVLHNGPVLDLEPLVMVYKTGYQEAYIPAEAGTTYLKAFAGTREERFEYLRRVTSATGCGGAGDSEKNLLPLAKALYEEARSIATTTKEQEFTEILLSISEGIQFGYKAAEQRAVERSQGQ